MAKEIPASEKEFLRAVLISSQGGVLQTHIEQDYKKMTGEVLQWRKLGFRSLYEFLLAIPDVGTLEYSEKHGENIMFGKAARSTYQSVHAKKAQNIPENLRPHRPPSEWSKNRSPDKSKGNGKSDGGSLIMPSTDGLYSLRVCNLPPGVSERNMKSIFGRYDSLKIINIKDGGRCALIKFSKKEHCVQALNEVNGHVLYKTKLILTSDNMMDLKPTKQKKIYPTANNEYLVEEDDGLYPIHVSNFPPKTTQDELLKVFSSTLGITPVKIQIVRKYAFVYFATKVDAITALQNGLKCLVRGKPLNVTPKLRQGQERRTPVLAPGQNNHAGATDTKSGSDVTNLSRDSTSLSLPSGSVVNGYGSVDSIENPYQSKTSDAVQVTRNINGDVRVTRKTSDVSSTLKKVDLATEKAVSHIMLSATEIELLSAKCGQHFHTFDSVADGTFNLLVTEVVDSCTFWANIDDRTDSFSQLSFLGLELQRQPMQPSCIPKKHDIGVARFTEDNKWYRCWCYDVSEKSQTVRVFYLDYGNSEWISWQSFCPLNQEFWRLPPQAVPCRLSGLEPKRESNGEPVKKGSETFRDLVCYKFCKARKCLPHSGAKPSHMIDVELSLDGKAVNPYMLSTGHVNTTKQQTSILPSPQVTQSIKQIQIRISWVDTSRYIYYQEVTERDLQILEVIEGLLHIYNLQSPVYPSKGLIAVKRNLDGRKERVQIETLISTSGFGIDRVAVRDVDTGFPEIVLLSCLSPVSPELKKMPYQAYRATLHMMEHTWPPNVRHLLMRKLMKREVLRANIVNRYPDGLGVVELFDAEGSFNERLMSQSRALLQETAPSAVRARVSSAGSADSNAFYKGGKPGCLTSGPEDWDQDMVEHETAETKRSVQVEKYANEHYLPPAPTEAASRDSYGAALPRSQNPSHVSEARAPRTSAALQATAPTVYQVSPPLKVSQGLPMPRVSHVSPVANVSQGSPVPGGSQAPMPRVSQGSRMPNVSQGSPVRRGFQGSSVPRVSQGSPVSELSQVSLVPRASQGSPMPNVSHGSPVRRGSQGSSVPRVSQGSPKPNVSQSSPVPRGSQAPMPRVSQGSPVPNVSQGSPVPRASQGSSVPRVSQGSPVSELSQVSPVPRASQGSPNPKVSHGSQVPRASQGSSVPKVSQGSPKPKISQGSPVPKVSQGSSVPKIRRETNFYESKCNDRAISPRPNDISSPASQRETVKMSNETKSKVPKATISGRISEGSRVGVEETARPANPPPTSINSPRSSVLQAEPLRDLEVSDKLQKLEELTKRLEKEKKLKEMETRVLKLQKELKDLDSEKAQLQEDLNKE